MLSNFTSPFTLLLVALIGLFATWIDPVWSPNSRGRPVTSSPTLTKPSQTSITTNPTVQASKTQWPAGLGFGYLKRYRHCVNPVRRSGAPRSQRVFSTAAGGVWA